MSPACGGHRGDLGYGIRCTYCDGTVGEYPDVERPAWPICAHGCGVEMTTAVADAVADAGRALIATVIAMGEIPSIASDVRPDDLPLPAQSTVWDLCRRHAGPITPHGLATLAAQLGVTTRVPDGGRAGWAESLAASHAVVPARLGQLVEIVRADAVRRHVDRAAVEASSRARSGQPAADIVEDLGRAVEGARAALAVPESPCISLATIAPERVTWLWTGRLAVGKVTVLDGLPGAGKSTVTCDLAARVSRGQRFPGDTFARPAGGVIFLAAEDGIGDTMVPRLLAAGADLARCHVWRTDALPSLPDDVGSIEVAIRAHGARLLICDPVTALLARDLSANADADVRRALTPLAALAEQHGICVVLLRHLNKRSGISALDRGGGSIGIAALARTVLLLGRDESDPDGRVLAAVKANLTRTPRSLRARIVDADGVGKIEWGDECDRSADDLVADPTARRSSKREGAADLLRSLLADGEWHRQREIEQAADAEGYSARTLRRAREESGVSCRQMDGGWWWRLAQTPPRDSVAIWPSGHLAEGGQERESNITHLQGQTATRPPCHIPPCPGQVASGSDDPDDGGESL